MKKFRHRFTAVLIFALILVSFPAQADDLERLYADATAAYNANDHSRAFELFSRAAEAGHPKNFK